jgi:hypothetical protein
LLFFLGAFGGFGFGYQAGKGDMYGCVGEGWVRRRSMEDAWVGSSVDWFEYGDVFSWFEGR